MTISEQMEGVLRDHLARQREITRNAINATSKLAQANINLILECGIGEVAARMRSRWVNPADIQTIKEAGHTDA